MKKHFIFTLIFLFTTLTLGCKTPGRSLKIGADVAELTVHFHNLLQSENLTTLEAAISECVEARISAPILSGPKSIFQTKGFDSSKVCRVEIYDAASSSRNDLEWHDSNGMKYRSNNVRVTRNTSDKLIAHAILEKTYNQIIPPDPKSSFSILLEARFPKNTLTSDSMITAKIECSPDVDFSPKLEQTEIDTGLFRITVAINQPEVEYTCTNLKGFINGEYRFEGELSTSYRKFIAHPGDVVNFDSETTDVRLIRKDVVVSFSNDEPLECNENEVYDIDQRICVKK